MGARAALPSETRFPRSRHSPPDKPPGSCGRRGAPGDSPSPNSRPGSQAPGRASKHSRPGHHLRAPFVSSATHPLRDRCRSKVHTCPAHPDGRPCAHRRAPARRGRTARWCRTPEPGRVCGRGGVPQSGRDAGRRSRAGHLCGAAPTARRGDVPRACPATLRTPGRGLCGTRGSCTPAPWG